ncbi:MAG: hypothetical protein HOU81_08965 [Hamadaea sp.]|uniref:hypothetical protein n=1 Tax=Hamadaea sp. TaxID=2024425 RepID=UPI0017BA0DFE|nr:hypothetical protein [Hamadaea sp.]NUR70938.1 hypothetical protein [Hamadaea sp.]NUT21725.1 hypothetical protein [Hamadaea sp.]
MTLLRRLLIAAGLVVIVIGAIGVLRSASVGFWPYVRFLFVSAVYADLLVMPLVLLAGVLAARLLPPWLRVPVQAGLYVSAAVAFISLPLVLGYGRDSSLPSALPRDYPRGLLIVLAFVWAAVVVASVWRFVRSRSSRRTPAST